MATRFLINGRPTAEWTTRDASRVRLGRQEPVCEATLLSPDEAVRRSVRWIRQFYLVFGGLLAAVFVVLAIAARGSYDAPFIYTMLGIAAVIVAGPLPFLYPYQVGRAQQRVAHLSLPGPVGGKMRADDAGLTIDGRGLLPWSTLTLAAADMLRMPGRGSEPYYLVKTLSLAPAGGGDDVMLDPVLFTNSRAFLDNVFRRLRPAA